MKATHQERMILSMEYEQETKNMYNPPKPLEWLEDKYITLRKQKVSNQRELLIDYQLKTQHCTQSQAESLVDEYLSVFGNK